MTNEKLTDREKAIVLETIRLHKIIVDNWFVPDYELANGSFDLSMDIKRDIRSVVHDSRMKERF